MATNKSDPKVLSATELSELTVNNTELQAGIDEYVKAHPELQTLVKDFVAAAVVAKVPAAELVTFATQCMDLHDKWNWIPMIILPVLWISKIVCIVSAYWLFVAVGGTWSLYEQQVDEAEGDGDSGSGHGPATPGRTVSITDTHGGRSFGDSRSFSMSEARDGARGYTQPVVAMSSSLANPYQAYTTPKPDVTVQ